MWVVASAAIMMFISPNKLLHLHPCLSNGRKSVDKNITKGIRKFLSPFLCKVLNFRDIIVGNSFCSVSINVTVWKCWVSLKLSSEKRSFQSVKPYNKIYIPWQHNENRQRFAKSGANRGFFLVFKYHSRNKSNITTAVDLGHQQLIILTRKRCCYFVRSLLHTLLWCIGRGKKPIQPRFIGKHLSFTLSNQSN